MLPSLNHHCPLCVAVPRAACVQYALVPHWLVMSTKEEVETFNTVAPDVMGDSYGALLQTLSWL